ncbi:MAG: 30S ribosomal protein S12 methylthiotransferase RimO [Chthoniobacterales bacterium]|nr:30S ribosomal protein S12 methylthiotransferase RimO [Chthoniobacterales bacterium]
MATASARPKIGMVSLGCAKNLVDAEIMLGGAAKDNFDLTRDPDEADVLVINTCGFIDQAKEESIDTILEMHQRRLTARPAQKIIVSGCLAQRYHEELKREIPEVDAFIGLDQIAEFPRIVREVLERPAAGAGGPLDLVTRKSRYIPDYDTPRFQLTPRHTVYVKIAEGCNHPCSFCVIPQMRGRHRSRTIGSVVAEARQLVQQGVKELNLISQDTTYFGMDLWEQKAGPRQPVDSSRGPTLCRLLEELDQIEGDFWIRLLYTHPAHWSDELIATIARSRKVARYVDMPLQHIHEDMLKLMRRETSRQHIEDLIIRMREGIPGLAIRTTFITGFPGENDEHFESLLDFIDRVRFERLGVFKYSQEEGSRAAKMDGQIPESVKNKRHARAMKLQQKIARELAEAQQGRTIKVLVEQPQVARSEHDAPDVDCRVFLTTPLPVGEFASVTVSGAQVYDLVAGPLRS